MNFIGRKIYYDNRTGEVLADTGERVGDVMETTEDQDYAAYESLVNRARSTVSVIRLPYGELSNDFSSCTGYTIDVNTEEINFNFDPVVIEERERNKTTIELMQQQIDELTIQLGDLMLGGA